MNLKTNLRNRAPLVGTFVKTTHYHNTEVLAHSPLDLLCLDAEHAPFDRSDLDACVLAAKSQQKPVIVRIPDNTPEHILNSLDVGADGLLLPHIKTSQQAQAIIKKCFYGNNGRGYAGSSRFASYTTKTISDNLANNQNNTCVIAQIEDLDALAEIDSICAIDEIDCIFIGRMDLTVSLGETDPKAESVVAAVQQIVTSANAHDKAIGMFVSDLSELPYWLKQGVSLFLLASDHSFMLTGAKALKNQFEQAQSKVTT